MMAARGGQSPAKVTKHLKGIDFPAKQPDLVQHARKQKAEPEAIELLENLPDREYGNMADVMKGMGEVRSNSAHRASNVVGPEHRLA